MEEKRAQRRRRVCQSQDSTAEPGVASWESSLEAWLKEQARVTLFIGILYEHIRLATSGRKIRSMMTHFAPQQLEQADIEI